MSGKRAGKRTRPRARPAATSPAPPRPTVAERLRRFLGTPFGMATLACVALAGWALWSGGALDDPVQRQVRSSSVYAAPEYALDQEAAERVLGNRRVVVAFLPRDTDFSDRCDDLGNAADGTLVLLVAPEDDSYESYGCSRLPGHDDENFGEAFVAESVIGSGVDQFGDRPLDALKVVAVNYDRLVRSDTVPDGARTISPSLPRFAIAAAALLGVVAGAAALWLGGRRAGRIAAARRERRDETADARSALSANAAVLAQRIIDLDARYVRATRTPPRNRPVPKDQRDRDRAFADAYRGLVEDYTGTLTAIARADAGRDVPVAELAERVEALSARADRLAAAGGPE